MAKRERPAGEEVSGVDLLWARLTKIEKKLDVVIQILTQRQIADLKELLK